MRISAKSSPSPDLAMSVASAEKKIHISISPASLGCQTPGACKWGEDVDWNPSAVSRPDAEETISHHTDTHTLFFFQSKACVKPPKQAHLCSVQTFPFKHCLWCELTTGWQLTGVVPQWAKLPTLEHLFQSHPFYILHSIQLTTEASRKAAANGPSNWAPDSHVVDWDEVAAFWY